MKTPHVKECPCCGHPTDNPRSPFGAESECGYAWTGDLIDCLLFWRCPRCKCRFRHNQQLPGVVTPGEKENA